MKLSVMFWNVWYENQLSSSRINILEEALQNFISEHNPDVVGLNEVVELTDKNKIPLNEIMSKFGYKYSQFARTNRINKDVMIGSGIYSKTKISSPKNIHLGENTSSKRKGFVEYEVSAAVGSIEKAGIIVNIIAAHPVNIKFSTLKDHYRHTSSLKVYADLLKTSGLTIVGGDINEPRFIPFSFRSKIKRSFHHKSGSFINPSWRYKGQATTMLRANLDRIFWSRDKNFSLKSFSIIDTNVSDHRPLISVFEIER